MLKKILLIAAVASCLSVPMASFAAEQTSETSAVTETESKVSILQDGNDDGDKIQVHPIEDEPESPITIGDLIYTASSSGTCGEINDLSAAYDCFLQIAKKDSTLFSQEEVDLIQQAADGSRVAQAGLGDSQIYSLFASSEDLEGIAAVDEDSLNKFLSSDAAKPLLRSGTALGSLAYAARADASALSAAEFEILGKSIGRIPDMLWTYGEDLSKDFITEHRLSVIKHGIDASRNFVRSYMEDLYHMPRTVEFGKYAQWRKEYAHAIKDYSPASRAAIDAVKADYTALESEFQQLQGAYAQAQQGRIAEAEAARSQGMLRGLYNSSRAMAQSVINAGRAAIQTAAMTVESNTGAVESVGSQAASTAKELYTENKEAVNQVAQDAGIIATAKAAGSQLINFLATPAALTVGAVGACAGAAATRAFDTFTEYCEDRKKFMDSRMEEIDMNDGID